MLCLVVAVIGGEGSAGERNVVCVGVSSACLLFSAIVLVWLSRWYGSCSCLGQSSCSDHGVWSACFFVRSDCLLHNFGFASERFCTPDDGILWYLPVDGLCHGLNSGGET